MIARARSLAFSDDRPNIVWITCEDLSPHLGCYGDQYADTPNLDRLAAKGTVYLHAWSNAPVCAPARTTIISGVLISACSASVLNSLGPRRDQIFVMAGRSCRKWIRWEPS